MRDGDAGEVRTVTERPILDARHKHVADGFRNGDNARIISLRHLHILHIVISVSIMDGHSVPVIDRNRLLYYIKILPYFSFFIDVSISCRYINCSIGFIYAFKGIG